MILIGYQGIGKSTMCKSEVRCLDLESSCTWVDGRRDADWYKVYCQFGEDLSRQGYVVFMSSHGVIREQLKDSKESICICCPDPSLKDAWIERLRTRYERTGLEKDFKAFANAADRFTENIQELMNDAQRYHYELLLIKDANGSIADVLQVSEGLDEE